MLFDFKRFNIFTRILFYFGPPFKFNAHPAKIPQLQYTVIQTVEYRHTLPLCHSKAQSTPRKLNHTLNKSQVITNKEAQFTHSQIFAHA